MLRRPLLVLPYAVLVVACATPDPTKELSVADVEAYWAIDKTVGDTVYLAPVVRFELTNRTATQSIEATVAFRREGESATWGSAWQRVSWSQKRVAPGSTVTLALKSDGRYNTNGAPESVFAHELFKDARFELFVRVGASPWTKMAEASVARRIGSKTLAEAAPAPAE